MLRIPKTENLRNNEVSEKKETRSKLILNIQKERVEIYRVDNEEVELGKFDTHRKY